MIKLLTSVAGTDDNGEGFSHAMGDQVSFDKETEKRMIDSGQAELVITSAGKKAKK